MTKRFIKRLVCLALPFVILFSLFFAFEPYDWFCVKGDSWYSARAISSKRILLTEHPQNLIFGDSHIANLNTDYIKQVSGEDWHMMAYGGATLNESIETFWFAAEHTDIKKVVFGLNFYALNDYHTSRRHIYAIEDSQNIFSFINDYGHWVDAAENLRIKFRGLLADITGNESLRVAVDNPSSLTQDTRPDSVYNENGERQDIVDYSAHILAAVQSYSCYDYCTRLGEIIDYCDQNGIEITFVLFANEHIIWDRVIYPMALGSQISYYKHFLKSRANVIDMEIDNEYAAMDQNFLDGFHMVLEEKLHMCRIIFANEPFEYCERTTPEQYLEWLKTQN